MKHTAEANKQVDAKELLRQRSRSKDPLPVHPVLQMQQAGNQAVQKLVRPVSDSSWQPLEVPLRERLEAGFGANLSSVRIHSDDRAHRAAADLRANAFTIGQDIYFGAGRYSPAAPVGFKLLAHEVAHTLQQPRGSPTQTSSEVPIGGRGDASEHEAAVMAERFSAGDFSHTMQLRSVPLRIQGDWLDDAEGAVGSAYNTVASAAGDVYGAASATVSSVVQSVDSATSGPAAATPPVASFLPGGTGDWHEIAQAITIIIAGIDLALIAREVAPIAIREGGAYTAAGGDYGPQNALRHCIFAGLLDSHGWAAALIELGVSLAPIPPLNLLLLLAGATMGARVRLVLMAHEWFADDSCGNFGTGTVDSECDQNNNSVGIGLGGPFTSDAEVITGAKSALEGGQLLMTPGPTDLSRTVSTAGWRTGPWMLGGPQQPDCSLVTKK